MLTGQIIDAYGSPISSQMDIILNDKSILPPVLIDDKVGLFPVESVLYTVEIKITLNAGELKGAYIAAKNLANYGYLPGLKDETGKELNHSIEKVRSVIFALGSDLKGSNLNEAERYKKIYSDDFPYLRSICVVDREYWYEAGDNWIGLALQEEFDEVLSFLGGVTNTYKAVSHSRHSPLLGRYIVPEIPPLPPVKSKNS